MKIESRFTLRLFVAAIFLLSQQLVFAGNLIEVSAVLQTNAAQKTEIVLSVTNRTSKTVKLSKYDIPWEPASSTLLFFVAKSNGVLLEQFAPIAQADLADLVDIKPSAELTGRIVLEDRVPTFEVERRKSELIIFWTYKPGYPFSANIGDQPRVGGWLVMGPAHQSK